MKIVGRDPHQGMSNTRKMSRDLSRRPKAVCTW